ncbi:MAG TPA: hypothetical protein VF170_14695 [Planctomycetaceae bacterium]
MRSVRPACLLVALAAALGGCEEPTIEFTETKGIDERLTSQDVAAVIAVLEAVGERDRSRLPMPFPPPPGWTEQRSLPVRELIAEERLALDAAWSPDGAAVRLPRGMPWDPAVSARRLTREQFCALVISVAASLARSAADPDLDLEELARRGTREIEPLARDERPFASLPPEERHATRRRAAWVTIAGRAANLARVPEENLLLVAEHRERLAKVLPAEFFADPFAGLYPRPEDHGVPFEEGDLSDAALTWSAENALIGTDRADGAARIEE